MFHKSCTIGCVCVAYFTLSSGTVELRSSVVLQRIPVIFVIFFCWAIAGFFTFRSKTFSTVLTSNLCRNIQGWN